MKNLKVILMIVVLVGFTTLLYAAELDDLVQLDPDTAACIHRCKSAELMVPLYLDECIKKCYDERDRRLHPIHQREDNMQEKTMDLNENHF